MAELGSAELTRWSVQLADRAQERRFRQVSKRAEQRTMVMVTAMIFVLDLVALVTSLATHRTLSTSDVATHAATVSLLVIAAVLLWFAKSRRTATHIVAAHCTLFVVVATLIAAGNAMAFGGALLLLAGVMLIYLTGRFDLTLVTGLAVVYTALIVPAWLATSPSPSFAEVRFTVTIIVLAHLLGFAETRHAQRERRMLFAHQEVLANLSATDELTGLINRREFRSELDQSWFRWQKGGTPMALVMLDLDHFKQFNDTFGHPAGDVALRLVGDAIRTSLSPADGQLGARYGGEEFMCLLPGATLSEATVVAERIRCAIHQLNFGMPRPNGGITPTLTVSGGVALPDMSMRHVGDLLQAVDEQLYRAKAAGRDCIRPVPSTATPSDRVGNISSCGQRESSSS